MNWTVALGVALSAAGPLALFVSAMATRKQPDGVPVALWSWRWWIEQGGYTAWSALAVVGPFILWHALGWRGLVLGVVVLGAAVVAALGAARIRGHLRRRSEVRS